MGCDLSKKFCIFVKLEKQEVVLGIVSKIKYGIKQNQREVKDIFYLIVLQGLTYVIPLLVLPYLMKVLGAEKFGYIGFATSISTYLMILVDFGFNLSATKKISIARDNKEELSKIFTETVLAKTLLLLISAFVLFLIGLIPAYHIYRETMWIMFLVVVSNAYLFVFLFQGMGYIKWVTIINSISKLSILPLTFWIVKSPEDYLKAALIQSMVYVFSTLLSWAVLYYKKWVTFVRVSWNNIKDALKHSLPLFMSTAATSVYVACYVVILGYFVSPEQVGQYSAVEKIMRALCYLLLTPILQVMYPYIGRLGTTDRKKSLSIFRYAMVAVFIFMSAATLFMLLVPTYFVKYIGESYAGSEMVFYIMAFAPIFIGLGGVMGQLGLLALGDEKEKQQFRNVYLVATIVSIISILLLPRWYGIIGGSISLLLTELLVCLGMFFYGRKFLYSSKS